MRRNDRLLTDITAIEEIIKKADVCRVAVANGNIPYIVTMNFGYSGGIAPVIYFHCAREGRKLEMIKINNYVCFSMDTDHRIYNGENGCDWGMNYKSVVGYGNISVVDDPELRIAGLDCIMKHYGGDKKYSYNELVLSRTTILRLDIIEMTGKKC